jgi:hypothetical protein
MKRLMMLKEAILKVVNRQDLTEAEMTRAASPEGWRPAVLAQVPPQTREGNKEALKARMAAAAEFLKGQMVPTSAPPVSPED